jgi:phospholipid/cholesterol/gamma-HCH transport system permease protein
MRFYDSITIVAITVSGIAAARGGFGGPGREALSRVLSGVDRFFEWFGELAIFSGRVARAAFTRPFELRELIRQMDSIGSKSLPLVALAGSAVGVVLSLQTRASLARFGAKSMLPAVIIFSIIKETGPIITALVVSGRVAAGIGAELGSMKVTEQIDAMEASAVDPYKYLAATRVIACVLMLPLLTVAADFGGILMGWVSDTLAEPISLRLFLNMGLSGVGFDDFLPPTLKTLAFGLIMGLVASFQGMRTQGGTAGVGRATTSAVVLSSLFIIVADVVLVRLILVFFPS